VEARRANQEAAPKGERQAWQGAPEDGASDGCGEADRQGSPWASPAQIGDSALGGEGVALQGFAGAEGSCGAVIGQEVAAAGGKSSPPLGTPAGGGQGLGSPASKAAEQQHLDDAEQNRADQAAKMKARDGDAEAGDLGPVIPGAKLNGDE